MSSYKLGMSLPDIILCGWALDDTLEKCTSIAQTQGYGVTSKYINSEWARIDKRYNEECEQYRKTHSEKDH